ncbi:alpha/beta hydrolase [Haloglycomyces albus]|uniref:alpha/beta hydrolase n=1 Tax=Haloglycomyces albus TaxID=526067 RepID=UPI00046CF520|nr:alpha/beta hydrolase [Haloglycomyces albus]
MEQVNRRRGRHPWLTALIGIMVVVLVSSPTHVVQPVNLTAPPPVTSDLDAELERLRAEADVDVYDTPKEAVTAAREEPRLARERVQAEPKGATGSVESAVRLLAADPTDLAANVQAEFFAGLGADVNDWLAVVFPQEMMNLDGVPLDSKRLAADVTVSAALEESQGFDSPPRPWHTGEGRPQRPDLSELRTSGRDFVYVDPYLNDGHGAWIESVGDIDAAESLAILVPGAAATIDNHNFDLYYQRAKSLVDAEDGDLAVLVWAGAPWPTGWVESSWADWSQVAGKRLARFSRDIGTQYPEKHLTVMGHSYGGAVVGEAERHPMTAEAVLHLASAGMGHGVGGPDDYSQPCRDRYAMTAPGDPISYVQGVPDFPLLGHGEDPAKFPGIVNLEPGYLPSAPDSVDDEGEPLSEKGILGKKVEGMHSHSEVFYPHSDAWENVLAFMTDREPAPAAEQPESYEC